ncbi:STAS domain-containing protein [Bacillus sp. AK128]
MNITIEVIHDVVQITLKGSMYVKQSITLREEAYQYIHQGFKEFSFDMESLEYIDSAGLGVLVGLHKKVVGMDGRVKLIKLSEPVKEILNLTRLNLIFDTK